MFFDGMQKSSQKVEKEIENDSKQEFQLGIFQWKAEETNTLL